MSWVNTLAVLLLAFLAVFLECHVRFLRNLLGAQIDLLPILTAYAALTLSVTSVILIASLGGLWFDCLSTHPLGVSVLPLAVTGVLIHHYRGVILRESYLPRFLIGLAASAAVPLMTLLLLLAWGTEPLVNGWSVWQWLVMAVGGAVLTPPCFQLFDWFNRTFNYRPEPESSFRPDREIDRGRDAHADH
jgi:rod shape-determining protein MreD